MCFFVFYFRDKSVQSYAAHQHPVNCIHCNETKIVSASWDNKVKIWDFNIPEKVEEEAE